MKDFFFIVPTEKISKFRMQELNQFERFKYHPISNNIGFPILKLSIYVIINLMHRVPKYQKVNQDVISSYEIKNK